MNSYLDGHNLHLAPKTEAEVAACLKIATRTDWEWNSYSRTWVIPRFAISHLPPTVLKHVPPGLQAFQPPRPTNPIALATLPSQLIPYPFQRTELLNLVAGSYGLWAAAGVGKTLMSLAAFYILREQDKVDGLLVVGPECGRHVWCGPESDAQKWIDCPGVYLESGGKVEPPESGICYTTAAKVFREPYHSWLANRVRSKRWVLCLDEVDQHAGALSQRFASLRNWARYCDWVWALTATPVRNYPDSFWGVYQLLTGHDSVDYGKWCKWLRKGRTGKRWHLDRIASIQQYLGYCTSTITKSEVAPWLPPVTNHTIKVPLRGKQKALYSQMVASGRMELEEAGGKEKTVVVRELLHRISCLKSVASHPIVTGDTDWKDADISKLDYVRYLCASHSDEKILIWSWHPAVLEWLREKLGPSQAVCYHGQVSPRLKEEAVHRFNNDPKCRFFLGNPAAAGASLNLGAGTVRIYWDLEYSWSQYHQSCERNNRITRTNPITGYVLMAENTIEESIWKTINKKMELASLMMSGSDAVFTTQMASEILGLWER